MKLKFGACEFLAAAVVTGAANAGMPKDPTAKDMLDECGHSSVGSEPCYGDLTLQVDELVRIDALTATDTPPTPRAYCPPEGAARTATATAVMVWVRNHPETWSMEVDEAINRSLRALYPCK